MSALDPEYLNRAAPPGSMRYFALLYTQTERHDLLTALFVVDAEIRTSATQVAHEVAHTRLQWWRTEVDRLTNRNAQHPATKVLQSQLATSDFAILHELLTAADMDVARMTYNNRSELNAYLDRSGGVLELFVLDCPPETHDHARRLGSLIRRTETLRDLIAEARAGRIYWPLDELDKYAVSLDQLRSATPPDHFLALLADETAQLRKEFDVTLTAVSDPLLRPIIVLAALHRRLLQRIAHANHDIFTQRHELGPIEKVWTAWRAARRV